MLTTRAIVILQRQAGNSAVVDVLKELDPPEGRPQAASVQRCSGGCAPGLCEAHEEGEPSLYQDSSAKTQVQSSRSQAWCAEFQEQNEP